MMLLSERMKNGTVLCRCNKCGETAEMKVTSKMDFATGGGAYLCPKCIIKFIQWLEESQ